MSGLSFYTVIYHIGEVNKELTGKTYLHSPNFNKFGVVTEKSYKLFQNKNGGIAK